MDKVYFTRMGFYKILMEQDDQIKEMFLFCADMIIEFYKQIHNKAIELKIDYKKLEENNKNQIDLANELLEKD